MKICVYVVAACAIIIIPIVVFKSVLLALFGGLWIVCAIIANELNKKEKEGGKVGVFTK